MNTKMFIKENQLRPADVIVLRKKVFGMFDHFAIYLGNNRFGKPEFIANFTEGVQIIPEAKINEQLQTYVPERIEKFEGNYIERDIAVRRAKSKIGKTVYSFLGNNCEHFKNWVIFGEKYSEQVDSAGTGLTVAGGALVVGGLLKSNSKATGWGLAALAVGLLLKGLAYREDEEVD
ncbi:lecithin retinol acyltransferase family protein [uncultured Dokdonia sp.]|uniref:lecithin retinol acyltransferase family protein n=1 Tax=uncultured Dokdonia sp. TaxID=575653 RepID=UPI00262035C1|nr:lecithin retinol acyltransferase family protein [uncultured Dokdonia sp.]